MVYHHNCSKGKTKGGEKHEEAVRDPGILLPYLAEYGITNYEFTMFTEMTIKVPVVIFVLIWAIFFVAAFLMTSLLYNRAVSKILIPLVILTAMSLDCDPRGLMEMCYIGSMCSLVTPIATSVVPMMMGAGGY